MRVKTIAAAGLWAPVMIAQAAILHVAPNGSDSGSGERSRPFKTISQAALKARPGDTVLVAPGVYRGVVKTRASGLAEKKIRFESEALWGARLIGTGKDAAWANEGSDVEIIGFDISGTGRLGILSGGARVRIAQNLVRDLEVSGGCNGGGGAGIDTYGAGGSSVIERNVVRGVGTALPGPCNTVQGIYVADINSVVANNIVSGVPAVGIHQWHGASASTIVNNTVFNSKIGILIGQGDNGATAAGSSNNHVANNIVYDQSAYGIIEYGKVGPGNRYLNNLVSRSGVDWKVGGRVSGSVSADPGFVDYRADGLGDYRLKAGSAAIDKGAAILASGAADLAGLARVQGRAVDIGAHESGSAPAPSPEPGAPTPSPAPPGGQKPHPPRAPSPAPPECAPEPELAVKAGEPL